MPWQLTPTITHGQSTEQLYLSVVYNKLENSKACENFAVDEFEGEPMQEAKRGWRTRAVFLILLWILLFAASLSLLSFLLSTFFSNSQVQSVISLGWSGYVVASDFGAPQPEVVGINASWIVPRVGASVFDSFSAAWIGIGGQFDKTLIQAGTEHDFVGDQEFYYVWYELLPSNAVRITTINLFPGDKVSASITLANSDANEWIIQIYDRTTGQEFNEHFFYNSSRTSAEWIIERPMVNNQISTLANFGNITFKDSHVNLNGTVGAIGSFPYSKTIMDNRANVQLTSVSPLSVNGSSFTVTYLAGG